MTPPTFSEIDYKILRKYIACFGTLSCSEDSKCPFGAECFQELITHPEKMKKALEMTKND